MFSSLGYDVRTAGFVASEAAAADAGARVVLMGTDPLFRAHPQGQHAVVARALLWTTGS